MRVPDRIALGGREPINASCMSARIEIPPTVRQYIRERPDGGPLDTDDDHIRYLARFAVPILEAAAAEQHRAQEGQRLITKLLEAGQPEIVFQPIVDLASMQTVNYEALARFRTEPYRSPDKWFAEAASVGLALDLETVAIANALRAFAPIRRQANVPLAINASIAMILDGRLKGLIGVDCGCDVVVEVTEHQQVPSYPVLQERLLELRGCGVRVAIDDIGAGNSGMQHAFQLRPDFIKVDMSLIRGIDVDAVKQAMVTSVVRFGDAVGMRVTAEGLETEAELDCLRGIGVHSVQGYLLGRPAPASAFLR